jgi:hypothetical protein
MEKRQATLQFSLSYIRKHILEKFQALLFVVIIM